MRDSAGDFFSSKLCKIRSFSSFEMAHFDESEGPNCLFHSPSSSELIREAFGIPVHFGFSYSSLATQTKPTASPVNVTSALYSLDPFKGRRLSIFWEEYMKVGDRGEGDVGGNSNITSADAGEGPILCWLLFCN